MSYRNRSVVRRIVKEEGVREEVAEAWFEELLKFLAVGADLQRSSNGYRAVPSAAVDAAWHAFILHTAAYADYCDTEFGHLVHHQPIEEDHGESADLDGTLDYLYTRSMVERRFGAVDPEVWPLP